MAEFVEVMKQYKRMCDWELTRTKTQCADCIISSTNNGMNMSCVTFLYQNPVGAEKNIMEWAAAHSEPKYPSWNETWKQLFPSAYRCTDPSAQNSPCIKYFLPLSQIKYEGASCADCLQNPITADVAEKLGIKPLEE